jgi:hypothetical protein
MGMKKEGKMRITKLLLTDHEMIFMAAFALIAISIVISGCGGGTGENVISDENLNTNQSPIRISVEELKDLLDSQADIVLVDTRSRESYDASHISGAISMEYPDEIMARHSELPKDKLIILYCS